MWVVAFFFFYIWRGFEKINAIFKLYLGSSCKEGINYQHSLEIFTTIHTRAFQQQTEDDELLRIVCLMVSVITILGPYITLPNCSIVIWVNILYIEIRRLPVNWFNQNFLYVDLSKFFNYFINSVNYCLSFHFRLQFTSHAAKANFRI